MKVPARGGVNATVKESPGATSGARLAPAPLQRCANVVEQEIVPRNLILIRKPEGLRKRGVYRLPLLVRRLDHAIDIVRRCTRVPLRSLRQDDCTMERIGQTIRRVLRGRQIATFAARKLEREHQLGS